MFQVAKLCKNILTLKYLHHFKNRANSTYFKIPTKKMDFGKLVHRNFIFPTAGTYILLLKHEAVSLSPQNQLSSNFQEGFQAKRKVHPQSRLLKTVNARFDLITSILDIYKAPSTIFNIIWKLPCLNPTSATFQYITRTSLFS